MKFIDSQNVEDYEVLGDKGFAPIGKILKTIPYDVYAIELKDGTILKGADDHIVIKSDHTECRLVDLKLSDSLITIYGHQQVVSIKKLNHQEHMYDLQLEDDNHLYFTNTILSHNTTTAGAYLLYEAIFNDNFQIAILANKGETATEIVERIKNMYENLPFFLQIGIQEWNKRSITFGNNSKIFSAATSSSSIRGRSVNCVDGLTKITVKDRHSKVITLPIKDFYKLPFMTYSVLSGDGTFQKFLGMRKNTVEQLIVFTFHDDTKLICTPEHKIFLTDSIYVHAQVLDIGYSVQANLRKKVIVNKAYLFDQKDVYDFIEIEKNNSFFANGIKVHQCLFLDEFAHIQNDEEFFTSTFPVISAGKTTKVIINSTPNGMNLFYKLWTDSERGINDFANINFTWEAHPLRDEEWKRKTIAVTGTEEFAQEFDNEFLGSSGTLLSRQTLTKLTPKTPIKIIDGLKLYVPFSKDHTYILVADVSEGVGRDYSVASIFDVTDNVFKQVAVYRNNIVVPVEFTHIIYNLALQFNECYCIIENNGVGKIVADDLFHVYEYENVLSTKVKTDVFASYNTDNLGLRQTTKTKRIGNAKLKFLIENDILLVYDSDAIFELITYVKVNGSYKAEKGKHDDIVMTMVMFSWFTEQDLFEDFTHEGIKKEIIENTIDDINFILYDDGTDNDLIVYDSSILN
jgi:hypothetical protein